MNFKVQDQVLFAFEVGENIEASLYVRKGSGTMLRAWSACITTL